MFFVTYKTYLSALHIWGAVSHVAPLPPCFTSTLDYVLWNPVSKTQLYFHSSLSRSTIQKDVRNKDMDSQLHRRLDDFNGRGPHLDRSQPCFGSQVLHGPDTVSPCPSISGIFFRCGFHRKRCISSANAAAPPSDSHSGAGHPAPDAKKIKGPSVSGSQNIHGLYITLLYEKCIFDVYFALSRQRCWLWLRMWRALQRAPLPFAVWVGVVGWGSTQLLKSLFSLIL